MSHPATASDKSVTPYQLFMLAICLASVGLLAFEAALPLGGPTRTVIGYGDTVLCGLFFLDFLYCLKTAPNKRRYLMSWGWIDLISSIPTVGVLRVGRLARVARLLRLIRMARVGLTLGNVILSRRAESAIMASALVCLLTVILSSVAILEVERGAGGNIASAGDALWWTVTTITTVGYGDTYPVTQAGRVVAGVVMAAGIGLFGTLSGLIAAWFIAPAKRDSELAEIKALLQGLGATSREPPGSSAPGPGARPLSP